jgi:hypothetical protein
MPEGHAAAQDYVRSVLGQDSPAPEPIQQELSPEEQAFLEQALEKMIAKEGELLEREYKLEDEINGVWYRGRFTLERIPNPELERASSEGRTNPQ